MFDLLFVAVTAWYSQQSFTFSFTTSLKKNRVRPHVTGIESLGSLGVLRERRRRRKKKEEGERMGKERKRSGNCWRGGIAIQVEGEKKKRKRCTI